MPPIARWEVVEMGSHGFHSAARPTTNSSFPGKFKFRSTAFKISREQEFTSRFTVFKLVTTVTINNNKPSWTLQILPSLDLGLTFRISQRTAAEPTITATES